MEQYYFTFYCDELCVDLECANWSTKKPSPRWAIKDSMTLVSAIPKNALGDGTSSGLDILEVMKLSLVDEIEAAALKDIHDTEMDF
jgi:hypothetical protein